MLKLGVNGFQDKIALHSQSHRKVSHAMGTGNRNYSTQMFRAAPTITMCGLAPISGLLQVVRLSLQRGPSHRDCPQNLGLPLLRGIQDRPQGRHRPRHHEREQDPGVKGVRTGCGHFPKRTLKRTDNALPRIHKCKVHKDFSCERV